MGSRPLVGSSRYEQPRAVRQRLGQLDELFHAQRVSADLAIANFAEADVEQRFVRALQGFAREATQPAPP